jgi:hypothetical protein
LNKNESVELIIGTRIPPLIFQVLNYTLFLQKRQCIRTNKNIRQRGGTARSDISLI